MSGHVYGIMISIEVKLVVCLFLLLGLVLLGCLDMCSSVPVHNTST